MGKSRRKLIQGRAIGREKKKKVEVLLANNYKFRTEETLVASNQLPFRTAASGEICKDPGTSP